MKVGDLVEVKTKFYGTKVGLVVKKGMDGYFIQPINHPRMIITGEEDCEVISECRKTDGTQWYEMYSKAINNMELI